MSEEKGWWDGEERPDDPGPLRRFFMTDGRASKGLILCIVLFFVLKVGVQFCSGVLYGEGLPMITGFLLSFVAFLILIFGFYAQAWANDEPWWDWYSRLLFGLVPEVPKDSQE